MEERLEALMNELVREYTSPSSRVEISFNGTSFLRQTTANRTAALMGTETYNFIAMCRARQKPGALRLAQTIKGVLAGIVPASIDELLSAVWCPSVSYVGEGQDGYHEVALMLAITKPIIQELKRC